MKKFEGLLKGEIKKVESFAQKRDGKDSRITGYCYHETEDAMGFITVKCEICSNNMEDRERDVVLYVYVPDRRRSFVSKALSWTAPEVQEAPKTEASNVAQPPQLNPMCEKCANLLTNCAGTYEKAWTACVCKTDTGGDKAFAPKRLRAMTDDQLLTAWESTEYLRHPQCPTIRGWLMDEIERRYPVDFNAWFDQDAPEDSQLRHYVMGRG